MTQTLRRGSGVPADEPRVDRRRHLDVLRQQFDPPSAPGGRRLRRGGAARHRLPDAGSHPAFRRRRWRPTDLAELERSAYCCARNDSVFDGPGADLPLQLRPPFRGERPLDGGNPESVGVRDVWPTSATERRSRGTSPRYRRWRDARAEAAYRPCSTAGSTRCAIALRTTMSRGRGRRLQRVTEADGLQVTRHPVVDRFHSRSLEGDGGVYSPAFGRMERGEGSSHGDLGRHTATVTRPAPRPATLSILVVIDRMVAMSNDAGGFGQPARRRRCTRRPATRRPDIRVSPARISGVPAARIPGLSAARLSGLPAARLSPAGLRRSRPGTQAGRHPAAAVNPDRHPQRRGRLHPGQPQGDAGADDGRGGDRPDHRADSASRAAGRHRRTRGAARRGSVDGRGPRFVRLRRSPARSPHCCRRSCSAAC